MQEQVNKAEVIPSPIHHGLVVYVSLGDIGDIGGWDYTSRTIGPNVGMRMANLIYIYNAQQFLWLVSVYIYIIYIDISLNLIEYGFVQAYSLEVRSS
jgi:hypothetical protein